MGRHAAYVDEVPTLPRWSTAWVDAEEVHSTHLQSDFDGASIAQADMPPNRQTDGVYVCYPKWMKDTRGRRHGEGLVAPTSIQSTCYETNKVPTYMPWAGTT